eukprot:CAMPEP_0172667152 /NCGR_PEP_ID=MMETSP1074-20121228/8242_1 /TAXON_ID=2916 /ORGANISM="Ceratium fusus, Strain PA161109" /LENGTH=438 /DNA_ID=CAMNT_0013483619 /DNA_START=59 /DNA_END=1376 /DNA_ORIENTATION=+
MALTLLCQTLALCLVALVAGHGALYIPSPRNAMDRILPDFAGGKSPLEACTCNNGNGGPEGPTLGCDMGLRGPGDGQSCLWWSQGCSIGCDNCATQTYGDRPITGKPPNAGKIGFRTRYCNSTMEPTLPRHAWTLNMDAKDGAEDDSYRYNPWRAPGFAPVVDPCGQAGGEFAYQKLGGDSVFYNTSMAGKGMMGSKLPPTPVADRTRWVAGTWVEVAWGPRYNHGGGYQYRLCPATEPLTEECFQRHPLDFDRGKQVLKWNNRTLQYPMGSKAVFVDGDFVKPKGSMWARNPIPRIWDDKLGLHNPEACPGPSTRENPKPGCLAFPAPCPWDTYNVTGLLPCDPSTEVTSPKQHAVHTVMAIMTTMAIMIIMVITTTMGPSLAVVMAMGWASVPPIGLWVSFQIMYSSPKICLQANTCLAGDGIVRRQPKFGRIVLM